jgi:acetylornithine deacetylase
MLFDPDKLRDAIDRDYVIDVAKAIIDAPSPTGHEGPTARMLDGAWKELGLQTHLQELYEERFNAVGKLAGSDRSAPTVLFSGHMDTSVRGDEDWLVGPGWKNSSVVVDNEWVYGNGIFNMKNALVSYTAMAAGLKRLGVELPGGIILAGTAGEIELAAIDEFQGREYDSYGVGMKYLMSHGYAADYHVLGEPSAGVPLVGMMGCVWAKVTTSGDFAHTAFTDKQLSAIEEAWELWRGLDGWREQFCDDNVYMGVKPQINRAAIRGGVPWRAARTPSTCAIYIDIRFPPNLYPIDVQRAFADEVQRIADEKLERGAGIHFYMSRPGTRLPAQHPVIDAMVQAHTATTGENVPAEFSQPYCTDAIESNRYGIPTVVYGWGGRSVPDSPENFGSKDVRAKAGEFMLIDDMVEAAVAYAVAAADLMERGADGIAASRALVPMPGVVEG